MRLVLIAALMLAGCGHAKSPAAPEAPTPDVAAQYDAAAKRLVSGFLEGGWVVSRKLDGAAESFGDSLLFSGIALHALPCAAGGVVEDALISQITRDGGALLRFDPLPAEYQGGREVSVDGAIGLYRGVAHRVVACPGSGDKWRPVLAAHFAYLQGHDLKLNDAAGAKLEDTYLGVTAGFWPVLNTLGARFDLAAAPTDSDLQGFAKKLAAWVALGNAKHEPAYRNNLALLALQTLEELGRPVGGAGRDDFCAATRGVRIPTVDEWCGREGIRDFVAGFQFDQWEYRHQRSGGWESPDGGGLKRPGLDLLEGIKQGYQIGN